MNFSLILHLWHLDLRSLVTVASQDLVDQPSAQVCSIFSDPRSKRQRIFKKSCKILNFSTFWGPESVKTLISGANCTFLRSKSVLLTFLKKIWFLRSITWISSWQASSWMTDQDDLKPFFQLSKNMDRVIPKQAFAKGGKRTITLNRTCFLNRFWPINMLVTLDIKYCISLAKSKRNWSVQENQKFTPETNCSCG